jgi:hypothetical protein
MRSNRDKSVMQRPASLLGLTVGLILGFAATVWSQTPAPASDTTHVMANPAFPPVLSQPASVAAEPSRLNWHGYGDINYQYFNWQTDPTKHADVDLERLAFEPTYRFSPHIQGDAEIEIEHGGTGANVELDKFDESGDFETDVEKGGEVEVEQLNLSFLIQPLFNIRVGHFFVPVGFASVLDEPDDYYTVTRSEAETAIIPVEWDETGVEINGESPWLHYQLQVINGLDAAGFSSENWIAGGHQGSFETINADDMAVAGRLETSALPYTLIGISGYFGNSAGNRPKPDLHVPAYVGILSAHAQFKTGPLTLRGLGIWGHLSNAGAVTLANQSLPDNLNEPRDPVASQAYASFVEAGLNLSELPPLDDRMGDQGLILFARIDSYNTMWKSNYNAPQDERFTLSGGVNYSPVPLLVFKGQYSHCTLGTSTNNVQNTFSIGLGFLL